MYTLLYTNSGYVTYKWIVLNHFKDEYLSANIINLNEIIWIHRHIFIVDLTYLNEIIWIHRHIFIVDLTYWAASCQCQNYVISDQCRCILISASDRTLHCFPTNLRWFQVFTVGILVIAIVHMCLVWSKYKLFSEECV